jgi:hypothetical protein
MTRRTAAEKPQTREAREASRGGDANTGEAEGEITPRGRTGEGREKAGRILLEIFAWEPQRQRQSQLAEE